MINGNDTLVVEPLRYEASHRAAAEALAQVRARRRRRRWRGSALAVVLLVAAGVAGLVWRHGSPPAAPRASVGVRTGPSGATITLARGRIDIAQLRAALVNRGQGDLLTPVNGGGVQLDATLVVAVGAHLDVDDTALFLRSDGARIAHLIVESGGTARFERDTVLSWTRSGAADTNLLDGRADIVATGRGARLSFVRTTVAGLGSDVSHPGVTWRNGASGQVLGSTFSNDYRGAFARDAGVLTIRHSTFSRAAENGLLLHGVGAGTVVSQSSFRGNKSSGIEVDDSTGVRLVALTSSGNAFSGVTLNRDRRVAVRNGVFSGNKLFGVAMGSSQATSMTGVRAFSNGSGAQVNGGSASITRSFFSGNLQNGVFVSTATTRLTLRGNRIDHNEKSGLEVATGGVTAVHDVFDTNRTGVLIDAAAPTLTLRANTIVGSSVDGVALTAVSAGEVITGNTFIDNAKAALSVPVKADLHALIAANALHGDDQPASRVRGK